MCITHSPILKKAGVMCSVSKRSVEKMGRKKKRRVMKLYGGRDRVRAEGIWIVLAAD